VTDAADATAASDATQPSRLDLPGTALLAVLAGVALCWTADAGAVELLVAVAVLQAALAAVWVPVLRLPGRKGAVASAAIASAASDVAVSVWPHARLAPLLAVLGLAVPVLLALQLMRGAARVRVIDSLAGVSLLLAAEIALPALLQIRHEFPLGNVGGDAALGVAAAAAGALAVGCLADLVAAPLRFDPDVPRGLSGVLASTGAGALIGYLSLRDAAQFIGGRGLFIGAAVGALVALLGVAMSFVERGAPEVSTVLVRRARPLLTALLPLFLVAPVALLLCIAIRA
jgi:hypothetical protein